MTPSRISQRRSGWLPGLVAAVAVLLLALYPHVAFRVARGREWNGLQAYAHGDEVVYAAYVNALIDGRPRRSDPYAGRDAALAATRVESYFSIQFLPPAVVAFVARLAGATLAESFVALTCFVALLSSLAIFWLIASLTGDARVAAAGVLVVLCLGSAHLVVEYLLGFGASNNYLPFLRRYVPSAPFPFFFIFCALVWRMLTLERTRAAALHAVLAGLVFALLVYSYFYLWTTAAAWLACLGLLSLALLPRARRQTLKLFAIVAAHALAALLPYFRLLSKRADATDEALLLTASRAPDLLRLPELAGLIIISAVLFSVRRGRTDLRAPAVVFTLAFALTPFVVFNQQIITGRSLQPFHYGMFIVNYTTALAALLAAVLIRRGTTEATRAASSDASNAYAPNGDARSGEARSVDARRGDAGSGDAAREMRRRIPSPMLVAVALVALASGAFETRLASRRFMQANVLRDEARPAALRLAALARPTADAELDTHSHVLATDYTVADTLPTVAPQPVLWSPHMFNFPGVSLAEDRERLAQYLFFTRIDFLDVLPERFDALDNRRKYLVSALISRSRHNPNLTVNWRPITPSEVRAALRFYETFVAAFDTARAARTPLSYVLTAAHERVDFSNLDRFYERDAGEQFGNFTLYRVRLRAARETTGENFQQASLQH